MEFRCDAEEIVSVSALDQFLQKRTRSKGLKVRGLFG